MLAFDFGTQRIGVAVGEFELHSANALTTIRHADNARRFGAIEQLVREWQPVLLVVGCPLGLDGQQHAMSARARRFANQLHGRLNLPVALADERLTSVEAERMGAGDRVDAVAAQLILQGYFDAAA